MLFIISFVIFDEIRLDIVDISNAQWANVRAQGLMIANIGDLKHTSLVEVHGNARLMAV